MFQVDSQCHYIIAKILILYFITSPTSYIVTCYSVFIAVLHAIQTLITIVDTEVMLIYLDVTYCIVALIM